MRLDFSNNLWFDSIIMTSQEAFNGKKMNERVSTYIHLFRPAFHLWNAHSTLYTICLESRNEKHTILHGKTGSSGLYSSAQIQLVYWKKSHLLMLLTSLCFFSHARLPSRLHRPKMWSLSNISDENKKYAQPEGSNLIKKTSSKSHTISFLLKIEIKQSNHQYHRSMHLFIPFYPNFMKVLISICCFIYSVLVRNDFNKKDWK